MGNEQAVADFPDETQRAAVAYRTYRDEDEEMEELELPGVSILEEGEAKGHDLFVDKVSLEKALALMKQAKNGIKVKMNHGSESHISIHTWPEEGKAAVDVYTCGDCNPKIGCDIIIQQLYAQNHTLSYIER